MGMTEQEYFQFQLQEQKKMVQQAYKTDPDNVSYVFYGYYGKVVWTLNDGQWTHEIQSTRTRKN